jgi:hypothetical protein
MIPARCAAASISDLDAVLERLLDRELATSEPGRERLPFQVLHERKSLPS